jgi:hypothetical protein
MYVCTALALHLQGGIANQDVRINISRSAVVSRAASSYLHLTGISEADLSKDEADVCYTASIGVPARAAHAATVAEPAVVVTRQCWTVSCQLFLQQRMISGR